MSKDYPQWSKPDLRLRQLDIWPARRVYLDEMRRFEITQSESCKYHREQHTLKGYVDKIAVARCSVYPNEAKGWWRAFYHVDKITRDLNVIGARHATALVQPLIKKALRNLREIPICSVTGLPVAISFIHQRITGGHTETHQTLYILARLVFYCPHCDERTTDAPYTLDPPPADMPPSLPLYPRDPGGSKSGSG